MIFQNLQRLECLKTDSIRLKLVVVLFLAALSAISPCHFDMARFPTGGDSPPDGAPPTSHSIHHIGNRHFNFKAPAGQSNQESNSAGVSAGGDVASVQSEEPGSSRKVSPASSGNTRPADRRAHRGDRRTPPQNQLLDAESCVEGASYRHAPGDAPEPTPPIVPEHAPGRPPSSPSASAGSTRSARTVPASAGC